MIAMLKLKVANILAQSKNNSFVAFNLHVWGVLYKHTPSLYAPSVLLYFCSGLAGKGKWDPRVGGFFPSSGGASKFRPLISISPLLNLMRNSTSLFFLLWLVSANLFLLTGYSQGPSILPGSHRLWHSTRSAFILFLYLSPFSWITYYSDYRSSLGCDIHHFSLFLVMQQSFLRLLEVSSVFFCFLREQL